MKFKKLLLLASSLVMLASCSSSSYFGKYAFLMGKDKPDAKHFKIELNLSNQKIARPVVIDNVKFVTTIPEQLIFSEVGQKFSMELVIESKIHIDSNQVFFEAVPIVEEESKEKIIASFENIKHDEEKYDVLYDTWSMKFTADLVAKEKGQSHFFVSYGTAETELHLFTVGDALQIDTKFPTALTPGTKTEIQTTFFSKKTDITLDNFYLYSTDANIVNAAFKTIEAQEGKYVLTGDLGAIKEGECSLVACFKESGTEILSQYVKITVKASTKIVEYSNESKPVTADEADDYYAFDFLIENTMGSETDSKRYSFNGGYSVKQSNDIALDIYAFGSVLLPSSVLNAVVKLKLLNDAVDITIPVSINDLMEQLYYVISTGDSTNISPKCHIVTLTLAKA